MALCQFVTLIYYFSYFMDSNFIYVSILILDSILIVCGAVNT